MAFDDEGDVLESQNLKEVRDYARRQERRAEKLEKELEAAISKVMEAEQAKTQDTLKGVAKQKGLSDEQIGLLFSLKPDADESVVEAFAKTVGAQPAEASSETPAEPAAGENPAPPATFAPVSGGQPPTTSFDLNDVKEALRTGNQGALAKIAAEAIRDPNRLDLGKYAHLID